MNKHIRFVSISASRIPSEYIEVRENLFIKLLLLFEEGTVKGMCRLIVEEFEAVEDLDGASSLDTNHATVNPIITITITNTNTITNITNTTTFTNFTFTFTSVCTTINFENKLT